MKIFAYGEPDQDAKNFVIESLKDHVSRFCYSWFDDCNLTRLAHVPTYLMTADEQEAFQRGKRLLTLQRGDWILHKNVPEHGIVTAVRICSDYFYEANPKPLNAAGRQDARHCFKVDKIFSFRRDDVNPTFGRKLRVMGSLYQVKPEKLFYESMQALGMPFDQLDCDAAKNLGVILSTSLTNTNNGISANINRSPQQTTDFNSPLQKISAIRENYFNELLKIFCNLPPDDTSRKEVLKNIFETLQTFSPDVLKKIISELFTKNGYRLIDDETDLVFELFSEHEPMHDLYKFADEPQKIFVHVNSSPDLPPNGDIHIVVDLTGTLEKYDGIILVDAETFVNFLARHGMR